ncbi:MAG TPA: FHA domain-containing protein [Verrucomicrobiae bacterium]|nr:FHA domain-containing protein [Verrucomicrobiae bacterium]
MAKLVIQNQGMTGRACELQTDRTTIGRVEDNTFQITDPSVSSHHCEIQLRGGDIVIRDLNSTNGSFINGNKIEESVLKPGQVLRLGQVELKLEAEGTPAGMATAGAPAKKPVDATMLVPRGVSLSDLEKGGRPPGFDTNTSFSKKSNKVNKFFLIGGIIIFLIIVGLIVYSYSVMQGNSPK